MQIIASSTFSANCSTKQTLYKLLVVVDMPPGHLPPPFLWHLPPLFLWHLPPPDFKFCIQYFLLPIMQIVFLRQGGRESKALQEVLADLKSQWAGQGKVKIA